MTDLTTQAGRDELRRLIKLLDDPHIDVQRGRSVMADALPAALDRIEQLERAICAAIDSAGETGHEYEKGTDLETEPIGILKDALGIPRGQQ